MAEFVGCMAMSHGPQLLTPPDKWSELPTRIKGPFHPKPGIEAELTPDATAFTPTLLLAASAACRDTAI
ncbi:MAG: hypothetical protein O7F14_00440 [Alphaproteobacteria bacterium]|nr:hypothetical protein [Alphaproteobacteria bacterium]